jgi:MFS family permease
MPRGRVLIDLAPFRENRDFRLLWAGYLTTNLGSQLTLVGVAYEVYRLSHSSLDVGLVSLAQLGPLLLGSLCGGAIADRVERRLLLIAAQLLLLTTSVGLGLNALATHPSLWPIFVCSAASAGFSGIDNPTRSALVVDLVGTKLIVQANAAWQVLFQTAQIGGPAVAGLLLGRVGVAAVFWIDVGTYLCSTTSLLFIRHRQKSAWAGRVGPGAVLDGIRFLRGNRVLQAVFLVDLNAMIFGMPRALFPALGLGHFHGGAETVGLLYSAPAVGALAGALLTGWVSSVKRQGRAVLVAVACWGAAITLFGLAPFLLLGLLCLAVAGASDVVSAIFRSSMLQVESPGHLRGRLQAVQTSVVAGGPRLGDLEAGAVAALGGPIVSVVSGGLACLAGVVVLARLMPGFAAYRARPAHGSSGHDDAGTSLSGSGPGAAGHGIAGPAALALEGERLGAESPSLQGVAGPVATDVDDSLADGV